MFANTDSDVCAKIFWGKWEKLNALEILFSVCMCVCKNKTLHLFYNLSPAEVYHFIFPKSKNNKLPY